MFRERLTNAKSYLLFLCKDNMLLASVIGFKLFLKIALHRKALYLSLVISTEVFTNLKMN